MIQNTIRAIACCAICAVAVSVGKADEKHRQLESSLRAAENAFAKSMADRDHDAFASFISPEAVFFGDKSVHRGRDAIAAAWAPFFEGKSAPFSWVPQSAAVLESGRLGVTSGPVFDPAGERIGTFNSVWRMDGDGAWRVVFDRGCPPCDCQ